MCSRVEQAAKRRLNPGPHRESTRRWQEANHDRYLAYQRAYRAEFGAELDAEQLEKRRSDPDYRKRYNAWRRNTRWEQIKYATDPAHRDRQRAKRAVYYAVKTRKLTKPGHCERCPGTPVQAHHYRGYAPEHRLDVIWLCADCHRAAEAA